MVLTGVLSYSTGFIRAHTDAELWWSFEAPQTL